MLRSLVGSEMCIRDSNIDCLFNWYYRGKHVVWGCSLCTALHLLGDYRSIPLELEVCSCLWSGFRGWNLCATECSCGYNRLKRTDYCALAQVIVQSEIAGFEYFPLQQLSMTPIKVCFEYVTLHNGLAFWSLPLSIRPTAPVVYQTANYDPSMKPLLYPQEHSVAQRFHPRKPDHKQEQQSSSSGMDL